MSRDFRAVGLLCVLPLIITLAGCGNPFVVQAPESQEDDRSLSDYLLSPQDLPSGYTTNDRPNFTAFILSSGCEPAVDFSTILSLARDEQFVGYSDGEFDDSDMVRLRQGIYVLDTATEVQELIDLATLATDGRCDLEGNGPIESRFTSLRTVEQVVPIDAEGVVWDRRDSLDGEVISGERVFIFVFDYAVVILEVFATGERYERVANELADRLWAKLSGD